MRDLLAVRGSTTVIQGNLQYPRKWENGRNRILIHSQAIIFYVPLFIVQKKPISFDILHV